MDQGYEFNVIPNYSNIIPKDTLKTLNYFSQKEQHEMLMLVKAQKDEVGNDEVLETAVDDIMFDGNNTGSSKKLEVTKKKHHALFKAWGKI